MQFPDSSWLFTTITPNIAERIILGNSNFFSKGVYAFPVGSPIKISTLPTNSISNIQLTPLNDSSSSFSSGNTFITQTGNTIFSITGTNNLGDPIYLGSTTIIGLQGPAFTNFSANLLGNLPGSPLQITYNTQNSTNFALTSNMRAINISADALSGTLTVKDPIDGEVFTLTATNVNTGQTEQIEIAIDNSNKIFNCIPPGFNAAPTGSRTILYGSGPISFCNSADGERLYVGRGLSIPALIYLGTHLIEINELAQMPLGEFNFYADGMPTILTCDDAKIYTCQPAGGKVTVYDNLTQSAIEEIPGEKPTNIEINDNFIVIKDNLKLKIFDKNYSLISQFDLNGMFTEGNDKEIFISSDRIFVLDGSLIYIINLSDVTVINKTIDLSNDFNILGGSLVFSELQNKLFIIGSDQPNLTPSTTITGTKIDLNLWVYDLTADELESIILLGKTERGDSRFGCRMDLDESRIFAVIDQLNAVFAISTDPLENFKIQYKWNTLKPSGIGLSPDGKYLYYTGLDRNSFNQNTGTPRRIIIMKLFEPQLQVEIQ